MPIFFCILVFCCSVHFTSFAPLSFTFWHCMCSSSCNSLWGINPVHSNILLRSPIKPYSLILSWSNHMTAAISVPSATSPPTVPCQPPQPPQPSCPPRPPQPQQWIQYRQCQQCQQCQQFIVQCYLHLWWYFCYGRLEESPLRPCTGQPGRFWKGSGRSEDRGATHARQSQRPQTYFWILNGGNI